MATVSYDGKAFIVGSHRIWVVSGAIHYFRVPRELWRDRLLKLKRAGLNTVETYLAWSAHEPREGKFDFSGGLDLDAFLTLAEELGLWVIVRPGPYMCAEWDNGGIPAWLNVKPGVKLRVANDVYQRHARAFFEKAIPIVARHQASNGGGVILVQAENEYIFRGRPGGREHLLFLRDTLRKLGIDVPILVCNFLAERIEGTLECWNCWDNPDKAIQTLRQAQPEAPSLITEFWCGCYTAWGHSDILPRRTPREVHAGSLKVLAQGGMYNYYMFHGGTSFGHAPGRTVGDDHVYMTSTYDYDAPLSETGALTEKYYKAKLASSFASNLTAFFGESEPASIAVTSPDDVEIVVRTGPQGNVIFVFNRAARRRTARLALPGNVNLEVSFADLDAVALPFHFSPVPGFTIDYSNLSLLGMMPMGVGRLVFLYGPRGKSAVLGAQGRTFRRTIGADTQMWFGNFPNLVAVMDTSRAERTWFLPDRTVVGGELAGDSEGDKVRVGCRTPNETLVAYFPNGRVNFATSRGEVKLPRPPKIGKWRKSGLLPEGRPAGARRVDTPEGGFSPIEASGYAGGYGWYHTRIQAEAAGERTLLLGDAEDRVTAFVGGRRAGTFGRGHGASLGLLTLPLAKGANDLHLLLDNLGRAHYGLLLGETKGLRAPAWLDARAAHASLSWTPGRYNGKLASAWQIESHWPGVKDVAATLSVVFEAAAGEGAVLRMHGIGEPAAVFVNRQFNSYYWGNAACMKLDLVIPATDMHEGRNLIELAFFLRPGTDASRHINVFAFDPQKAVKGPWHFKALGIPASSASVGRSSGRRNGDAPLAWHATFELENPPAPVFLVPEGLRKGEIWLNGRMVSRHWDIGPQKRAYLPEPWLKGTNEVTIIDEFGASPSRVRLEYDGDAALRYESL